MTSLEDKINIYRRFSSGNISRAQARDLIGDECWATVAQIASIRRARDFNTEQGYSGDELADIFG